MANKQKTTKLRVTNEPAKGKENYFRIANVELFVSFATSFRVCHGFKTQKINRCITLLAARNDTTTTNKKLKQKNYDRKEI
jgi:hypothetical protein